MSSVYWSGQVHQQGVEPLGANRLTYSTPAGPQVTSAAAGEAARRAVRVATRAREMKEGSHHVAYEEAGGGGKTSGRR